MEEQQTTQPSTPPKKFPRKKLILILLALILVIGGGGTVLAWRTTYLDNYLPASVKEMFGRGEKPEEEPGEKPEEKPEEGPTKDWKTWENKSFGFSFKYPKTYQVTKEEGIEVEKVNGALRLSDKTRSGNPWMYLLFNSAGHGGACYAGDIDYETSIEDGEVIILSRMVYSEKECLPPLDSRNIMFDIGARCKTIAPGVREPGGDIAVVFSFLRTGPDYEPELKEIIKTIRITKEEIYCK